MVEQARKPCLLNNGSLVSFLWQAVATVVYATRLQSVEKKNSYLNYNNNTSCTTADGFAKSPKLRDKRVAEGNSIVRFIKTVGGSRFQYVYTVYWWGKGGNRKTRFNGISFSFDSFTFVCTFSRRDTAYY